MADTKPFQISVPQKFLDRLQQKLAVADFPDELDDAAWDYGVPLSDVKRLVQHWQTKFDWRAQEKKINELPMFKTNVAVDGFGELDIHFVHQRSSVVGAIPLLFVHGWPGSFLEVSKVLPLLARTESNEPAFHVVAPSLPNFGFSEGVKKRGFSLPQFAEVCHNLMQKLGYTEYVTQGGDWGFWITRTLGRLYPSSCKASHINMINTDPPSEKHNPHLLVEGDKAEDYTPQEKQGLERFQWFKDQGQGYSALQATKPQTLGYGLRDSPVLLLAWIREKMHDWTDDYPWTDDEILTWVCVYWFSVAGPATSVRIYYEVMHEEDTKSVVAAKGYVPIVKLGLAFMWRDVEVVPKAWARTMGEVVFESSNDRGGHFAAWERPDVIAKDLKSMFSRGSEASKALEKSSGYD